MFLIYIVSIKVNTLNFHDVFILLFVLVNCLSIISFCFSGLPFSVYFREFSNTVLPIGFYFLGKSFCNSRNIFYKNIAIVITINMIIGLFLFFYQPDFYRIYLDELEGVGLNILSSSGEFRSLVGLTMTGSLGFILSVISSKKMLDSRSVIWSFVFVLSIIVTFLTFRRSAMIVVLIQILLFVYLFFKHNVLKGFKLSVFLFGIILFLLILVRNFFDVASFWSLLTERFNLISEGINERKGSWYSSFEVSNWLIGDGLGVYGHKAVEFSEVFIPDGYYFRLLAELGLPGVALFFILFISALIKSFFNFRFYYIEFSIILGLSLQAIGSDIFSFQLVAPIFWFACGSIHSNVSKANRDSKKNIINATY
jgi:hypothetical protein